MFRKRFIPVVLISCMLTSYLPLTAYASEGNGSVDRISAQNALVDSAQADKEAIGTNSIDIPATGEITVTSDAKQEPTKTELEDIINKVKSKISIPKELSEFEYYFNTGSDNSSAIWTLIWQSESNSKRITVQSDQSGNIVQYYSNSSSDGNYVPKFLKAELKSNADQFIKKIASNIYEGIEYVGAESQGTYSGQYVYQYQRVENDIPMPDNTISVGVNYETGKVVSYNANWLYNVKIPSADVLISKTEAAAKIGKEVTMKLEYQNAYTTDENGKTKIKAFLVYSPDQAYVAVDAKTGEVYTTQDEWIDRNQNATAEDSAGSADKMAEGGLTQEEITKVEELSDLISKEEAIKVVTDNKSLLLDKSLKSISASLYKQNDFYDVGEKTKYVWNISLSDPRNTDNNSGDTYRAYASATVDAETGKLISFNANVKDYYNMTEKEWEAVKVKYSSEEGQKILEGFLKLQIPDLLKNSVLTDNKESYVIAYKDEHEVYGGYYYQYERVNEGINYSYNGIYGAVDGVTGKIYSYSYNWNKDITFESPKNIITAEKAFDSYISYDGFVLAYEINNLHINNNDVAAKETMVSYSNSYSLENEIRLVYRTDISPAYISPFTGKQLNYDGEEYNKDKNVYSYNDIKDHDAARSILLLADIGIGFTGGYFLPEQEITNKELGEFLSLANYYYNSDKYKLKNDNSSITRLEASKFIIQILGFDNIAKLKGIYSADFKDKDQISEEYLGYAVLAQGLKLISSNNNEFGPTLNLTRAETAEMIIAMLSVKE